MPKTIAVAGKGGTGKSTIAALIINNLCKRKFGPILAIDADADSNLGALLGIEPSQSIGELRESLLKKIKDFPSGMSKARYFEAGLHQIIEEADGFDLITMGRGEGAGCYCYLNSLIRKFSEDLTPSYNWVVIDNEAGLEHISRRTSAHIDVLCVIVTENPLSIASARRIASLTKDLNDRIVKIYLITNMIKNQNREAMKKRLAAIEMEYLCDIPYNKKLEELIFRGESIRNLGQSPVNDCISAIINTVGG